MWLLDHNLPRQLRELLIELGVQSDTAAFRGWERLRNGDLVSAAHGASYSAIITRDVKFAESASKSLPRFPEMAIVIIRLPQRGSKLYLSEFKLAWTKQNIVPKSGQVLDWPSA